MQAVRDEAGSRYDGAQVVSMRYALQTRSQGWGRQKMTIDFRIEEKKKTAAQYWIKTKLPVEFHDLNMKQLTALRRMVQSAFNAGKKNAR